MIKVGAVSVAAGGRGGGAVGCALRGWRKCSCLRRQRVPRHRSRLGSGGGRAPLRGDRSGGDGATLAAAACASSTRVAEAARPPPSPFASPPPLRPRRAPPRSRAPLAGVDRTPGGVLRGARWRRGWAVTTDARLVPTSASRAELFGPSARCVTAFGAAACPADAARPRAVSVRASTASVCWVSKLGRPLPLATRPPAQPPSPRSPPPEVAHVLSTNALRRVGGRGLRKSVRQQ